MSEIYTAQQMRKIIGYEKFACTFITRTLGHPDGIIIPCTRDVSAMLRYAAGMVERCEKIKVEQPFDSVINTANYILRGDAGKEEK